MQKYWRQKNQEAFENEGKNKFDFTDMHFDLGPAEKIFGPGGVQIKTQGSAEVKMGANMKKVDNPALAASRRKTFGFDFDELDPHAWHHFDATLPAAHNSRSVPLANSAISSARHPGWLLMK